jgi:hypothetical protein
VIDTEWRMARAFSGARWMVMIAVAAMIATPAAATRLYATYVGPLGSARNSLFEIDPDTAEVREIAGLPDRLWSDLAGRPGDTTSAYAVTRLPGADYRNTLSTIDVSTGAVTDHYSWTASDLGLTPGAVLEFGGISISHEQPHLARISLATSTVGSLSFSIFDFELNLETGSASALRPLSGPVFVVEDQTRDLAGSIFTLAHLESGGVQLARVDESSASVQLLGGCIPCQYRAIDFNPDDGRLFAVDSGGELLVLSSLTGLPIDTIGMTGLGYQGEPASVTGLAFIIPEPATGVFLGLGLGWLGWIRRNG